MKKLWNNQLIRLLLLMSVLVFGLAACFKDAGDGSAAPTKQQVNLRDIEQQRTPSITPTSAPIIPTFTPDLPTRSKTLVIGGPPVGDGEAEIEAEETLFAEETDTPAPTNTNVPPDVATIAPPGFGNSGISPTPSLTSTPSHVPGQPTPTALATQDNCIYTVQGGDTLYNIARAYDLFPEDFYPFNLELQANPNSLYLGQAIRIPNCTPADATPSSVATSNNPVATVTTAAPTGSQTYTIAQGDTLFSIAQRHNVSLASLLAANGLTENSIIHPGNQLIIPSQ